MEPALHQAQADALRTGALKSVSGRLFLITFLGLLLTSAFFAPSLFLGGRFLFSWFSFGMGVIGGFVSIQQRLKSLSNAELHLLSQSWWQLMLYPLFGGIFAILIYILTLSGLVQGSLFPTFTMNSFSDPATTTDFRMFLESTYPASGPDFAKLTVWCFAAGFSERLVPDILDGMVKKSETSRGDTAR